MLSKNRLAFSLPVLAAGLLTLGGCYTMLQHPDAQRDSWSQASYSDCASCHLDGFQEPILADVCDWCTDGWWPYYGRPWWLSEADSTYTGRGTEGRHISTRGTATGPIPTTPPSLRPSPAVQSGAGKPGEPGDLPPGKTQKQTKSNGADRGGDDSKDNTGDKDENPPSTPEERRPQ